MTQEAQPAVTAPAASVAPVETQTPPVETPSETGTRISEEGGGKLDINSTNTNKDSIKDSTIINKDTLTQVQGFLESAGLVPSEIAKEFTGKGELSIESMAKLVEKHGESVAGLIVGQLKGLHEKSMAQAKERDSQVFTQVEEAFKGITEQGGEETWQELATWAKTNVPNEARSELNGMLAKGGLQAKLAVDYLISTFKSSESFSQPAELLGADKVSASFGSGPLSKTEYQKELDVLLAKGHDYNTSPEIRKLDQRRMKGMSIGM